MMILLYLALGFYLTVGLVYAARVLIKGIEPWQYFPLNMLLGPVVYLFNYYWFVKKGNYPKT